MAIGMRNRIFGLGGNGNDATLVKANDTAIVRWVKISGWANPLDPEAGTYFENHKGSQMGFYGRSRKELANIWCERN